MDLPGQMQPAFEEEVKGGGGGRGTSEDVVYSLQDNEKILSKFGDLKTGFFKVPGRDHLGGEEVQVRRRWALARWEIRHRGSHTEGCLCLAPAPGDSETKPTF